MTNQKRLMAHGVVMATLLFVGVSTTPAGAEEEAPVDIKAIAKRLDPDGVSEFLDRVQKRIEHELVQQKTMESAKRDLQELKEAIDRQIEQRGGEAGVQGDPILKVHTRILTLLGSIDARLPDDGPLLGISRRTLLPVPQYDERKKVGEAANQLHAALEKLRDHLQADETDRDKLRAALREVILAQEKLAWEAGWPFTAKEASIVKKAGELTTDVYLKRRQRGVARINEHLQRDARSAGRDESNVAFVLHRPQAEAEHDALSEELVERRGPAAKHWMEHTEPIDQKRLRRLLESRSR